MNKAESQNWFMLMAERDVGPGCLMLRGMFSAEPWTTPRRGFPELFQTGETFEGRAIIDAQHPHDLFMELAAAYNIRLSEHVALNFYGGPVGEPALGPTAFMHRMSSSENPAAPLGHHWQDSTHITHGVITAGITAWRFRVESSCRRSDVWGSARHRRRLQAASRHRRGRDVLPRAGWLKADLRFKPDELSCFLALPAREDDALTLSAANHFEVNQRAYPPVSTQTSEMAMIVAVLKPSPMRVKFSCLAIVALTMWLGGFGCALCCATGVTESCCLDERNAATDCDVKSCCTQAEAAGASGTEDAISQLPGVIGCSLLPDQTRSLAPLTRVSTELPDGIQAISSSFAINVDLHIAPSSDPPLPLNRGGTYLRYCALLI